MTPAPSVATLPLRAAAPIEITEVTDGREWDAFVRAHPGANVYHQWAWRTVFAGAFRHEGVYLAARQGGRITGVLPLVVMRSPLFGRFAVSLPFIDGGGLCTSDDAVAHALVERARVVAADRSLSHVEIRHESRRLPALPAREHKVGMKMGLAADATAMWDRLDRKVRNQVRKAEKSELTARSGGKELVDAFYPVFARNMRDLGTPVYTRRLFDLVLTTFPDNARVFIVEKGSTVVGGAVALTFRDTMVVPWASSLREFRALCPNNLLYWRMIEHAIASGLTTFDFGRSTPGEGTYQFKEQWGAGPVPLAWEYVLLNGGALPQLNPSNPKFKTAVEVWKRLPLALTSWLGPRIVRSIP